MTPHCNVCQRALTTLVYESVDDRSVTTMNTRIPGKTRVFFCEYCAHLQTAELFDQATFYANEYDINSGTEAEDQLYKIVDGTPVYRAEHQFKVVSRKLAFSQSAKVLDFGCAKAPTLRKLVETFPEISPYLFDLTDRYIPFWNSFPRTATYAVGQIPGDWDGAMDVVLSFYALEHASDLRGALATIRAQLKIGGTFYFVVPNVYDNVADLIVADHVNHFSEPSLRHMLALAGFDQIDVDGAAHEGAYTVTARKAATAPLSDTPAELAGPRAAAIKMGRDWREVSERMRAFEDGIPADAPLAIYGAGFYANFLVSCLQDPDRVACFIDRNVHLQGTMAHGKPVIAPDLLPDDVKHLIVALNPAIARRAIEQVESWKTRDFNTFFL